MSFVKRIFVIIAISIIGLSSCSLDSGKLRWQEHNDYQYAKLSVKKSSGDGFQEISPTETGIPFENRISESDLLVNRHYMHGSGVAIGDVNGDGWEDIYLCKMNGPNSLYLNRGNWQFEEKLDAGVGFDSLYSTGCALVDIDGDQDLDLFVSSMGGPVLCCMNNGDGQFTKQKELLRGFGSTTLAFADIDQDNDLDLYITNYKSKSLKDSLPPDQISFDQVIQQGDDGRFKIHPEFTDHYTWEQRGSIVLQLELGETDQLLINNGQGDFSFPDQPTFFDQDDQPISSLPKDWGLVAQFRDFNNDAWPDLYVCNDYESPDYIFINHQGKFKPLDNFKVRHTSNSSMSVDFTDLNQDGTFDFFVSDMLSRSHRLRKTQMGTMTPTPLSIGVYDNRPQYMRNTLHISRDDNSYAEIARYAGVQASEWSWSTQFLDVDLDGLEDLLITTGHLFDVQDSDSNEEEKKRFASAQSFEAYRRLLFNYPRLYLKNIAFRNIGDYKFEVQKDGWGIGQIEDVSHGMAIGDLDQDGDLDLVINRLNRPVGIFKNITSNPRIGIQLEGKGSNTQAVGARLECLQKDLTQVREVTAGGKYLSSNSNLQTFAIPYPVDQYPVSLVITWPDQTTTSVAELRPNRMYKFKQETTSKTPSAADRIPNRTLFTALDPAVSHHEDPFDDFALQSLLPNRLSQLGPGLSCFDYDQDGTSEIWLPSGRGGILKSLVFTDQQWSVVPSMDALSDQNMVLGIHNSQGTPVLVTSINGMEVQVTSKISFQYPSKTYAIALPAVSAGMLSAADTDGDGDLDIFAAGRSIPGEYPKPASSFLLSQHEGIWVMDTIRSRPFQQLGMVTSSCFSDLDQDGDPDLILALEWGPIEVFINDNGSFSRRTSEYGLDDYLGWWNGVSTADVNNDGKLDILAANWGENTKYHVDPEHPLQVFYGDFDQNEVTDIVEAHYDPDFEDLVPERGFSCMSNAMPFIKDEKKTFANYASSDLGEIFGNRLDDVPGLKANLLQSGIFINRGDSFEFKPLPVPVQWTTSMHISALDFDADGNEDLILSQNFFAVQNETDRNDGGRALLLRGNGQGDFQEVDGADSGIKVYGEQRGVTLTDLNRDQKIDILIAQNGAEVRGFLNNSDMPGTTVSLKFLDFNPKAIGAQINWVYPNEVKGPVREVKAGHGYWSQDDAIQVLGKSVKPEYLQIKWPNGEVQMLDYSGEIHMDIAYEPQ